ncbi:hypothetical protein [Candidatus Uabimicrobium sp. HlEnr_7]|uniref:hypothetical protein n=1 Tax=Candidatus Uabimicrobium helgolandensis TaxID=3095367 RepID=UPI0035562F60
MSNKLPKIFDKRYDNFREYLLSSIPKHTSQWTNFNPSDPGIVILELLAYLAESTLYRIDAIPHALHVNFLRLVAGATGEEINKILGQRDLADTYNKLIAEKSSKEEFAKILSQKDIDEAHYKILQFLGDVEHYFHLGSFYPNGLIQMATLIWMSQKQTMQVRGNFQTLFSETKHKFEIAIIDNRVVIKAPEIIIKNIDIINIGKNFRSLQEKQQTRIPEKTQKIVVLYKETSFTLQVTDKKEVFVFKDLASNLKKLWQELQKDLFEFTQNDDLANNLKKLWQELQKDLFEFTQNDDLTNKLKKLSQELQKDLSELAQNSDLANKLKKLWQELQKDLFEFTQNNKPQKLSKEFQKDLMLLAETLINDVDSFSRFVNEIKSCLPTVNFIIRKIEFKFDDNGKVQRLRFKGYNEIRSIFIEKQSQNSGKEECFLRICDWTKKKSDINSASDQIHKWLDRFSLWLECGDPQEIFREEFSQAYYKNGNFLASMDYRYSFVQELNNIIQSGSLHNEAFFSNSNDQLYSLIAKREKSLKDIMFLNRSILEQKYPQQIRPLEKKNLEQIKKQVVDFWQTPYRTITKQDIQLLAQKISYYNEQGGIKTINLERVEVEQGNSQWEIALVIVTKLGDNYGFATKRTPLTKNLKEEMLYQKKWLSGEPYIQNELAPHLLNFLGAITFKIDSLKIAHETEQRERFARKYLATVFILNYLCTYAHDFFKPRMLLGTEISVKPCSETFLFIYLKVQYETFVDTNKVQEQIEKNLYRYLDPHNGGTNNRGREYNKKLYTYEIQNRIQQINGVIKTEVTLILPVIVIKIHSTSVEFLNSILEDYDDFLLLPIKNTKLEFSTIKIKQFNIKILSEIVMKIKEHSLFLNLNIKEYKQQKKSVNVNGVIRLVDIKIETEEG